MGNRLDARTRDVCVVGSCTHSVWSQAASVRSVTMARNGRDGAVGLWLMDDHVGAVFGHDRVSAVSEWLRSHRVGSRTESASRRPGY